MALATETKLFRAQLLDLDVCFFSSWLFGGGCFFCACSFDNGNQLIWSSAKAIELSSGKAQLCHLDLVVSSAGVALASETKLF